MKLLYVLNIDWRYTKQRPQFLAEALADRMNVLVVSPRWNNKRKLVHAKSAIKPIYYFQIPFTSKSSFFAKINCFYLKTFFKKTIASFRPDYIMLSNAMTFDYFPKEMKAKIIYDVMDDYSFFFEKTKYSAAERRLFANLYLTVFSSLALIEKYKLAFPEFIDSFILVRNAFGGKILDGINVSSKQRKIKVELCYFGAISSYFDFETINGILKMDANVSVHCYGPFENVPSDLQKNDRFILHGVVSHDELFEYVSKHDAFIMPFVVNDLVKCVDPVKLYEYINMGKPILSVFYDEIAGFSPFVSFYRKIDDCISFVNRVRLGNCAAFPDKRVSFLEGNSWGRRAEEIIKHLGLEGDRFNDAQG